ncbi:MAG TPA: response regulator [Myxococcales bacterium]|jgi:DNA-binding response OmpR family regulator|nr:response regulator [Myxococcales bacterium]
MPKRILFIDSDESFTRGLQAAASAHGFTAVTAANSDAGLTLARKETPDLIVVCVESQPTNGYMLCTRLKKDDQLKSIPVILTSSNATPESFEKHKKLKTRAEEYLIKPFEPSLMMQKASELLGMSAPNGAAGRAEEHEEIVSMEDEPLGMGEILSDEDEPISLTDDEAAEARVGGELDGDESVVVEEMEDVPLEPEPQEPSGGQHDDELQMFDRAFDAIGGEAAAKKNGRAPFKLAGLEPVAAAAPARRGIAAAVRAAPVIAPVLEEETLVTDTDDLALEAALSSFHEGPAAEAVVSAGDTGDLGERVHHLEMELAERTAELEAARKSSSTKPRGDKEVLRLREELNAKDQELLELQEAHAALEAEALKREAATKTLQQRSEALSAAAKKFERELAQARDELKAGGGGRGKVAELEKRVEELESEHSALTGEKELLSEEREELRHKLAEAQQEATRNEERAVKAYQKIKSDERLREKTRKALQVALQLLEEKAAASAGDDDEQEKQSA